VACTLLGLIEAAIGAAPALLLPLHVPLRVPLHAPPAQAPAATAADKASSGGDSLGGAAGRGMLQGTMERSPSKVHVERSPDMRACGMLQGTVDALLRCLAVCAPPGG
jgi:hypothetical protein